MPEFPELLRQVADDLCSAVELLADPARSHEAEALVAECLQQLRLFGISTSDIRLHAIIDRIDLAYRSLAAEADSLLSKCGAFGAAAMFMQESDEGCFPYLDFLRREVNVVVEQRNIMTTFAVGAANFCEDPRTIEMAREALEEAGAWARARDDG